MLILVAVWRCYWRPTYVVAVAAVPACVVVGQRVMRVVWSQDDSAIGHFVYSKALAA